MNALSTTSRYVRDTKRRDMKGIGKYMKWNYKKPEATPVRVDLESPVLDGSVTAKAIKVNNVTVEDFSDGFASQGGFEEITFE